MNSLSVMRALSRIERLYAKVTRDIQRVTNALDADERRVVAKLTKGLATIERAQQVIKPKKATRPRLSKAARKAVRRMTKKATTPRRESGTVAVEFVRALALPMTAKQLQADLKYKSMGSIYAKLSHLMRSGLVVKTQDGQGYVALSNALGRLVPEERKTNGADTSEQFVDSQPRV